MEGYRTGIFKTAQAKTREASVKSTLDRCLPLIHIIPSWS